MNTKIFKIGQIAIKVNFPEELTPPANFLLFETDDPAYDYEYRIEITDSLPELSGTLIAEREDIKVFRNDKYESRLLAARGREGFYGYYEETDDQNARILLDRSYEDLFSLDTVFSSIFALERRILPLNDLVLHCAYLNHDDKAILFSAPSGVGKSTQAGLWEKYLGSKVENGDRSLLSKEGDKWYANGWPVCGSSEICNNTKHPIAAIVTLSQATENEVSTLSKGAAFSKLFGEITINSWDRDAKIRSMDLLEDLTGSVPVYHLACDISREAVDVLYHTIFK